MADISCFLCIQKPKADETPDIELHCGCLFHNSCITKNLLAGFDSCPLCFEKDINAGLIVKMNGMLITDYPSAMEKRSIVLLAVQQTGEAYLVLTKFKDDPEIIRAAIKTYPAVFDEVPENMITKELILYSLSYCDKRVLFRIPSQFAGDLDIAAKVVQIDGLELENLPIECCSEYDINMLAVQQNGLALKFVTMEWLGDIQITEKAVQQNGMALEFASGIAKKNPRVVIAAIKQNKDAIKFVNPELINHPRVAAVLNKPINE